MASPTDDVGGFAEHCRMHGLPCLGSRDGITWIQNGGDFEATKAAGQLA